MKNLILLLIAGALVWYFISSATNVPQNSRSRTATPAESDKQTPDIEETVSAGANSSSATSGQAGPVGGSAAATVSAMMNRPPSGSTTAGASSPGSTQKSVPGSTRPATTPQDGEETRVNEELLANTAQYLVLKKVEQQWRKSPPEGFYLLKLQKMYSDLSKKPMDEETGSGVVADLARIGEEIEAADILYSDVLKRERQLKQRESDETWLLTLINECEKGLDTFGGAPASRRLTTFVEQRSEVNKKSIEKFKALRHEENDLRTEASSATLERDRERKQKRVLRSLFSDYRSIASSYRGTQGGVDAYKRMEQIKAEMDSL